MRPWLLLPLIWWICVWQAHALTEAQRAEGKALLEKYTLSEDSEERLDLLEELIDLDASIGDVMWKRISKEWASTWADYQKQFTAISQALAAKKDTNVSRRRAKELTKTILSLSQSGEPSKGEIREKGDPALRELQDLRQVRVEDVVKASPTLSEDRERVYQLANEYNTCIEELVLIEETKIDVARTIKAFEQSTTAEALPSGRDLPKVNRENAKLADEIPPEALEGIRDLNELRSLLGLSVLLADPKLCLASYEHSKNMKTLGFFAHESPVPGSETITKRAAKAGTSTSGENISHGQKDGLEANRAWWHSPGHHVNLLNPKHKRIGLGHHAGFWTQMFGK